jgi:hypothetical protein
MRVFVLWMGILAGCGIVVPFQSRQWVNYALQADVQTSDKALIDGDPTSAGARTLQAYVILPEPHPIQEVIVYSDEVLRFEMFVRELTSPDWRSTGTRRDGPGKMIVSFKKSFLITAVRLEVRESTTETEVRARLWEEAYRLAFEKAIVELENRSGPAYQKALARRGYVTPLPYINPVEEADIQARVLADEVLKEAQKAGKTRTPARIGEIELLGPPREAFYQQKKR